MPDPFLPTQIRPPDPDLFSFPRSSATLRLFRELRSRRSSAGRLRLHLRRTVVTVCYLQSLPAFFSPLLPFASHPSSSPVNTVSAQICRHSRAPPPYSRSVRNTARPPPDPVATYRHQTPPLFLSLSPIQSPPPSFISADVAAPLAPPSSPSFGSSTARTASRLPSIFFHPRSGRHSHRLHSRLLIQQPDLFLFPLSTTESPATSAARLLLVSSFFLNFASFSTVNAASQLPARRRQPNFTYNPSQISLFRPICSSPTVVPFMPTTTCSSSLSPRSLALCFHLSRTIGSVATSLLPRHRRNNAIIHKYSYMLSNHAILNM